MSDPDYKRRQQAAFHMSLGRTAAEVAQFKADIRMVCETHGISISHEDGHGAFMLERFDEDLMKWLEDADSSRDSQVVEKKEPPPSEG